MHIDWPSIEIPGFISHLTIIIGFILATLTMAQIITKRRSPSVTIAWLLVIVLIPYLGVPLYLLFGGRKIKRIVNRKAIIKLPEKFTLDTDESARIDRILRSYGIPSATVGNSLTLHCTGEEGYGALVESIRRATRSIYIATFIFHMDEVGREIAKLLTRRASEGIEVKLLIDGVGSLETAGRFLKPLTKAGGKVSYFMPVFRPPLKGRTNLRNHRKIVIFDQSRVMAGGTNIASEYIGPTPNPNRWRDLSFTLEGPAVLQYAEVFRFDWEFATTERIELNSETAGTNGEKPGDAILQIVPSGPDMSGDPLYYAIIQAIFSSKRSVRIVTPYFIPDEALFQALLIAIHRGVDVRILVPEKSNHSLPDLARGNYMRTIQAEGGKIYQYAKGMMHTKIMLVDDELAMLGSANMDIRSLFLNYETAMFVYSKKEIQAVADYVERLESESRVGVKEAGAFRELYEGLARMTAPLL